MFSHARHLPRPLTTLSNHSLNLLSSFLLRRLSVSSSTPASHLSSTPCLSLAAATSQAIQNHRDLLSLCSSLHSIDQTKQTHALSLSYGLLPSSVSLCAALILSYATFGNPKSSAILFEATAPFCKTAFLWNILMRGYRISGLYDGFGTYNRMIRSDVRPDDHTFPSVLKACADYSETGKGREVHGAVIKLGFDFDVHVGNTLMLFYSSCGDMADVDKVFEEMPERDVVSWNTAIGAFSVCGRNREAADLFLEMMLKSGLMPSVVTVISVLPVCAELEDEVSAGLVHCYVVKAGLDCNVHVGNALLDAYGKCGNMGSSWRAFDEMVGRSTVSWNAIITSLSHAEHFENALNVFMLMIEDGEKPNDVTISSMLPVLVELKCFNAGKEIHGFSIRTGLASDLFVANSLIDMYAKSGHPVKASNIFYQMGVRNTVSWNAMVANFAQNGREVEACELIGQMQAHGENPNAITFTNILPACARVGLLGIGKEVHARSILTGYVSDPFISNALIDMYAKCGSIKLARKVFDVSKVDRVSYNTLIVAYSQASDCLESLDLFKEMITVGMELDTVSFVGVLAACANLMELKKGKEIHGAVVKNLLNEHLFVANSLLDLYTKCGKLHIAQKVFEHILQKDTSSWNIMVAGYGMLGQFEAAVNLFEAMREDSAPHDAISYIAVLSACSHGGLVEEGKKYFDEMLAKGMKPTSMHYACMVDLLGRAGMLREAVDIVKGLPAQPDASIWSALLGACKTNGNVELAKWAAEQLFVLRPDHCGYYVLLSNMLSEAGRWDEAKMVRERMKSGAVAKNPGCSWVQIQGRLHTFLAGESVEHLRSGLWAARAGSGVYS